MVRTSSVKMNFTAVFLAFAMLLATVTAGPGNRYGWPSSYERFLEKQGVWDYNRHEVRSDYGRRGNYERNLNDLYDDWKKQTRWGQNDYRSNRFQQPSAGYGRYGFPGGK